MKVGDTIWRLDKNHRVYREGRSGPVYREHWVVARVIGETPRSWITDRYNAKVPKKGTHYGWAFTQKEVDDDVWLKLHRYRISRALDSVRDPDVLRKVAEIIGYDSTEG